MQKYSITSRRLLITFGVLSACVLSACPSGEAPPGTCQSNGKSYDVEEEFWDECNRCTCKGDGVVSCTDKLCGHSDSCSYNGKQYPAGASFPAGDGCNTCGCTDDGQVACTLIACPPVKSCSYNGTLYPVGSAFPADDGCNSCKCTSGGITCTDKACLPPDNTCVRGGCAGELCSEPGSAPLVSDCAYRPEFACFAKARCERQSSGKCGHTPSKELDACLQASGGGCSYNGAWHPLGDSFPSSDGCNSCKCGSGGSVACTKRACLPDPKPCIRTGCSGEICADEERVSTCIYRDVYACYENATCARQANGECGFTPTVELARCVASHGSCQGSTGISDAADRPAFVPCLATP